MMAPAWPIRFPGGAAKPATYATTGFDTCSEMNAAACSSSLPPISPISTTASVWGSCSNRDRASTNPIPWTGSPPMPMHVDWPIPRWDSSWTIWYVSVPDREIRPTGPGEQISPGMIPTFDFPGEIRPGQFGPTSSERLPAR